MGKLSQSVKDRKCNICGEYRLRTAPELKAHAARCLQALKAHVKIGGTLEDYTPPRDIC